MTVKSVLAIDIQDASFQRFLGLFNQYQSALAQTPKRWQEASKQKADAAVKQDRITAAMLAQTQLARESNQADEKQAKYLTQSSRLWTSMASSTKGVAANIANATTSLLKWTGIIGATGGLLGIGSLFGLERLSANVSGQRRSSMGLGLSVGEQQAFNLNFGRLVDPDSFLETVNEARANPAEAWKLGTLGVSTAGSTSDVALRALDAMRARALATPENQLGLLDTQTGLQQGVDVWRRLHDMSQEEYDAQRAHYVNDVASFGTNAGTNRGWQDFTTQLSRAGTTLADAFQTRIGKLAPELTNLSDKFVKLGTTVINSDFAKDAVTKLGEGIDWLADKIGSTEFQQSVEHFFSEDGPMMTAAKRFGDVVGTFVDTVSQDLPAIATAIHAVVHPIETAEKSDNPVISGAGKGLDYSGKAVASTVTGIAEWFAANDQRKAFLANPDKAGYVSRLNELNTAYKLPDGLLRWQWQQESGSNLHPVDSKAGAQGPFQLMPGTVKDLHDRFGLSVDPYNPLESAVGAAEYDQWLMQKYRGDTKKFLAAYNWGPENLDKDIKAHPTDWDRYLPEETKNYVSSYARSTPRQNVVQAQSPGITVNINNNTGGDATVSVSQQIPH